VSDDDEVLARVDWIADRFRLTGLVPQIRACRDRLRGNEDLDVAVFGRFKAGKSSFLNHLACTSVLPAGVTPVTAVITHLRFGPVERAEVRYLDGRTEEIPLADVVSYVGEEQNPDNVKRVATVAIELPSLQALAPLRFVDTPGIGSAFAHNTEEALAWLPNVGVALVAMSVDAPMSEGDIALLGEIRRYTPKIALLLTKADLLNEAQRAEVLAFVSAQLRREWQVEWPVLLYSILPAAGSLKADLERALLAPLIEDRKSTADDIVRHKLGSLVAQTLDYLHVALAAATSADSSRRTLQEGLLEEHREFDLLREQLRIPAQKWSAGALERSLDRLHASQRELASTVTAEIEAAYPGWQLRLPAFIAAFRGQLRDVLQRELAAFSRDQQALFCEPLQMARSHLERAIRAFHDRLAARVQAALGVTMSERDFDLPEREPTAPPIDVGYAFDLPMDTLGYVVPMAVFRRPIERYLLRVARYEVRKNVSRLAAAWRDRVAADIDALVLEAEHHAADEIDTLKQALSQAKSSAPELRAVIEELTAMHAALQARCVPTVSQAKRVESSRRN
jgi:GTP-binding protein EngB required for normal cell division